MVMHDIRFIRLPDDTYLDLYAPDAKWKMTVGTAQEDIVDQFMTYHLTGINELSCSFANGEEIECTWYDNGTVRDGPLLRLNYGDVLPLPEE